MKKTRVIIFDDNPERRKSLEFMLALHPEIEFGGAFNDCTNVLDIVSVTRPDVVLMDIQMPVVDGIEGVKLIKSHYPGVSIIMQTVFEDADKVFESILSGASGYILKKAPPDKIIEAINDVIQGGSPMTPIIASKVLTYFQKHAPGAKKEEYHLSEREFEILAGLVDGKSYKMIADTYGISYHTVNSHVKKIYNKLHVNSLGEAVGKALREGLV